MLNKNIPDESGEPVAVNDLLAWGRWFETNDCQRQLADTTIADARVSTVFLGLDHSHGGRVPILWETMVFGGALDQEQRRYATRADALAGHTAMVRRVLLAAEGG